MSTGVELPRSYSGLSDAAKPKNPEYGVFFYNLMNRRIERWDGETWEVVAQPVVGMAPFGTEAQLGTPRLNDAIAAAMRGGGGTGSVGGSGSSPAPGNTASPTEPMPGGSPSTFVDIGASAYAVGPVTVAAGGSDTFLVLNGLPMPAAGDGACYFWAGIAFPAAVALGDCELELLVDGVVVASSPNVQTNHVVALYIPAVGTLNAGQTYLWQGRVRNLSGAPFDYRDRASDLIMFSIQYV